jgi:hypothetical protein
MAQNINLRNRVRFFPGLKKKDLPPMFDSTLVATVPIYTLATFTLPESFTDWNDGLGNYNTIVGLSGDATVSDFDMSIWDIGITEGGIINTFNGEYPVYYNEEVNPETGLHSGFMFYTIYDLNVDVDPANKSRYSFLLDIWESRILINNATDYDDIK